MTDTPDQQGRCADGRKTKDRFTVHSLFLRSLKYSDAVPTAILSSLTSSQLNSHQLRCEQRLSRRSCLIPTPHIVKTYFACSFMYYVCVCL